MRNTTKRGQAHISHYQARTRRPLTAYPLTGDGASRVIPGGALVEVTENTAPAVEDRDPDQPLLTATAYLGGIPYECEIQPGQFTAYPNNHQ